MILAPLALQDELVLVAQEDGGIAALDTAEGALRFVLRGHSNRYDEPRRRVSCRRGAPSVESHVGVGRGRTAGAAHRVKGLAVVVMPQTQQPLVASVSSDGTVRVWNLNPSERNGEATDCLAVFNADVRLTCVEAYVPSNLHVPAAAAAAAAAAQVASKQSDGRPVKDKQRAVVKATADGSSAATAKTALPHVGSPAGSTAPAKAKAAASPASKPVKPAARSRVAGRV